MSKLTKHPARGPRVGAIVTEYIIRESRDLFAAVSGRSYGDQIDDAIREAIESNQEMRELAIHFERSDWEAVVAAYRDSDRDYFDRPLDQ